MRILKTGSEQRGVSDSSATEPDCAADRAAKRKRDCDLSDLLRRVTADNRHPEQETGEPQGNERW